MLDFGTLSLVNILTECLCMAPLTPLLLCRVLISGSYLLCSCLTFGVWLW